MNKKCILILGGAHSGKSCYARKLAQQFGGEVLFVATAEPLDEEMLLRIEEHKRDRPRAWRTLEAPINLGKLIAEQIRNDKVVIIDCLTLLISNLLTKQGKKYANYTESKQLILAEIEKLIQCISKTSASFIIVSNEVGMGLVPNQRLGRIYRDLLGESNQILAQYADEVYFICAGIPVKLKAKEAIC